MNKLIFGEHLRKEPCIGSLPSGEKCGHPECIAKRDALTKQLLEERIRQKNRGKLPARQKVKLYVRLKK